MRSTVLIKVNQGERSLAQLSRVLCCERLLDLFLRIMKHRKYHETILTGLRSNISNVCAVTDKLQLYCMSTESMGLEVELRTSTQNPLINIRSTVVQLVLVGLGGI